MIRWSLIVAVGAAVLSGPAKAADYAPLDCSKAQSPAERAVCQSYALGQDESRMATLFGIATSLVAMGQRGDIRDAQRRWIAQRDACGANLACLSGAYRGRIAELSAVIDSVAARGPF